MAAATTDSKIAGRYAKALFALASEQNALDDVARDLESFGRALKNSPELRRFIKNPVLSREVAVAGIEGVLSAQKAHPLTLRFAARLAQNRRLLALDGIITAFLAQLARSRGEITAEITAATELPAAQQKAITGALGTVTGKKIRLETRIDPQILGGLIVKIGSLQLDQSTRGQLERLRLGLLASPLSSHSS